MAEQTAIEWCDSTWSPWEGCTKVSPGCDHCYAEGMNRWLHKGENWGPGAPRRIYSEDHWEKPIRWQRNAPKFHTLHGRRQRVFPSVCDPFDNEALPTLRTRFWQVVKLTPALDWLVLTKRIGNAKAMLPADWGDGYPNVWLGATVVNQSEADRDVPKLLAVPARVRFLSVEPMLGSISLAPYIGPVCDRGSAAGPGGYGGVTCPRCEGLRTQGGCPGIDWVIAGGESGPKARPAHPDWARSLRDQCAAAGVPFLWKQWGEWAPAAVTRDERFGGKRTIDFQGGGRGALMIRSSMATARTAARPMEPGETTRGCHLFDERWAAERVGKAAAGRLLDGVEHNGFPGVAA